MSDNKSKTVADRKRINVHEATSFAIGRTGSACRETSLNVP